MAIDINIPSQVKTYANLAAFPATGSLKTIFIAEDTNKTYRWTGSAYVEISASQATAWGAITGTLSSQTDLQTALNAKVTGNTAITGATKTKVTYDSKGLVTAGADATTADIADSTNKRYVTDANLTVIGNTSGTNTGDQTLAGLGGVPTSRTLTINGTTQDLSADRTFTISTGITIGTTAITSGTVGRVLFEGTGNVVQESANLFWDNTNGRLGIGTSSPSERFHISTNAVGTNTQMLLSSSTSAVNNILFKSSDGVTQGTLLATGSAFIYGTYTQNQINVFGQSGGIGLRTTNGADAHIRFYSGNSDANFSTEKMRLVASTGNVLINTTTDAGYKLDVNGTARVSGLLTLSNGNYTTGAIGWGAQIGYYYDSVYGIVTNVGGVIASSVTGTRFNFDKSVGIGTWNMTNNASAVLQIDSTTKGFLCPRMTTTQKNAIATPAEGLQVWDTTLKLMSVYNGTAWITL